MAYGTVNLTTFHLQSNLPRQTGAIIRMFFYLNCVIYEANDRVHVTIFMVLVHGTGNIHMLRHLRKLYASN